MPFIRLPGTPGKVYVPEGNKAGKKHKCPDCTQCGMCSASRCRLCKERRRCEQNDDG